MLHIAVDENCIAVEYQKPSALAIEAMDFTWQHRLRFKSLRFVLSSGECSLLQLKFQTKTILTTNWIAMTG